MSYAMKRTVSNEKVDFLMEIMKARTSTRQQQAQEDTPVHPFCTDCGVSDYDNEVRDQPPNSSSPDRQMYAFDYYGNPITQQDLLMQRKLQQQMVQQQAATAAASSTALTPHSSNKQHPTEDDYSEFLAEAPKFAPLQTPQSPHTQVNSPHAAEVVQRGCVAEFGHCMSVAFCCAADTDLIVDAANNYPSPKTQRQLVYQEINDELVALRKTTLEARSLRAMQEFELRAELAELQRQKLEMEESYRREIAREVSAKVLLQAQLQSKLLSMMEERMLVEVQLDKLNVVHKPGSTPSTDLGSPSKSTALDNAVTSPATNASADGQNGEVATQVNARALEFSSQPSDPPMRSQTDPSPSGAPTTLTSTFKASPTRAFKTTTTPFGLSIVVESEKDSNEQQDTVSFMSPTANRSLLSPTMNRSFSPTMGKDRSPPASNKSCEPEGRTFEKDNSKTSPSNILNLVSSE